MALKELLDDVGTDAGADAGAGTNAGAAAGAVEALGALGATAGAAGAVDEATDGAGTFADDGAGEETGTTELGDPELLAGTTAGTGEAGLLGAAEAEAPFGVAVANQAVTHPW